MNLCSSFSNVMIDYTQQKENAAVFPEAMSDLTPFWCCIWCDCWYWRNLDIATDMVWATYVRFFISILSSFYRIFAFICFDLSKNTHQNIHQNEEFEQSWKISSSKVVNRVTIWYNTTKLIFLCVILLVIPLFWRLSATIIFVKNTVVACEHSDRVDKPLWVVKPALYAFISVWQCSSYTMTWRSCRLVQVCTAQ